MRLAKQTVEYERQAWRIARRNCECGSIINPMNAEDLKVYACPQCRSNLKATAGSLECANCGKSYQTHDGIPDFLLEDLGRSAHPVLRKVRKDRSAGPDLRNKAVVLAGSSSCHGTPSPPLCKQVGTARV
jgi:uncharacterized protein YbaR (Trm112 family)